MLYYKADSAGNLVPVQGTGNLIRTEAISDDITLTREDSGKTYLLDAVGEAITLPALADGLSFRFRCTAAVTTSAWTITSATSVIEGYAAVAYASVIALNENTISLVHTKAIAGDEIELYCDGTSWHVNGHGSVAASITFTDV